MNLPKGKNHFQNALRLAAVILLCSCADQVDDSYISLQGEWKFQIDSADVGEENKWFNTDLSETINLPGSMTENGKGNVPTLETHWTASIYDSSWYFDPRLETYRTGDRPLFPFMLTPNKEYVGAAWYQRQVIIPSGWVGKRVTLFLERAHWETTVWVDGQYVGMQNSLVAPHIYELTSLLSPGTHTITMRIDNRIKEINVGQDSHSISDHTQGNWNGVIGRMELQATDPVWISDLQVYPDLPAHSATILLTTQNAFNEPIEGTLTLHAQSFNSTKKHVSDDVEVPVKLVAGANQLEVSFPMGEDFLTWDEFDPALYMLHAEMALSNGLNATREVQFGMREFGVKDTRFQVNGRPVFLRGDVDCAIFPKTGYPPMDVASWERIFKIRKAHGLNHVRFHSWSPPEAAFIAADKVGFYLQVEGPSWANHGTSIGDGKPIDEYIYDETDRIATHFGNYASFCMLAYGNEPAGRNQAAYLNEFVSYWKQKDTRHLYTGASVGKSWPYVDSAEFIVKSYPRGVPVDSLPNSTFDHHKHLEPHHKPYVSHEIGQYCVFPNFKEIVKYDGVYQARNFELFKEDLADHGMLYQAEDFLMASGKLQALFYKAEIEAALRTPGFAGFQMLQLNDFSGQGTALVGVLDAFFEEKGYISAEQFSAFCGETVPLARLPKFVYQNKEMLRAEVEISHFGANPLTNKNIVWKILYPDSSVFVSGAFENKDLPIGNAAIGRIDIPLDKVHKATKMVLNIGIEGMTVNNRWEFWVYPFELTMPNLGGIIMTDTLTSDIQQRLESGATVLMLGAGKVQHGKEVEMHFKPVFWNTSWFKMRPPHTLGHLTRAEHPAFDDFPTDSHSNYQWWEVVHKQQVMILDDFPEGFKPLVQPIDTWFLNRKLGLIFECRVGKGKLMVSSADLLSDWEERFVAKQLFYSLVNYMHSDQFQPQYQVDFATVKDLFEVKARSQFSTYSNENPDELQPKKH